VATNNQHLATNDALDFRWSACHLPLTMRDRRPFDRVQSPDSYRDPTLPERTFGTGGRSPDFHTSRFSVLDSRFTIHDQRDRVHPDSYRDSTAVRVFTIIGSRSARPRTGILSCVEGRPLSGFSRLTADINLSVI
jgi:hypothetical protein